MRQTIMKFTDKPRFNRLVRAWREGMKPAPLYADDLADTRSLYRRRWVACLDVALDIIKNSPDKNLVAEARRFLFDARAQLPKTFAEWADQKGVVIADESQPAATFK
jgi:hypothetical protein